MKLTQTFEILNLCRFYLVKKHTAIVISERKQPSFSMLEYTSCLFATVAVHAFACGVADYQYVFQLVTMLSILYHTTNNAVLRVVDTAMAHLAFLFVMLDSQTVVTRHVEWLFLFPAAVSLLWMAEGFFPRHANHLHGALHVASAIGANAYVHVLHSKCTFRVK